jgi:hypothetical protein
MILLSKLIKFYIWPILHTYDQGNLQVFFLFEEKVDTEVQQCRWHIGVLFLFQLGKKPLANI